MNLFIAVILTFLFFVSALLDLLAHRLSDTLIQVLVLFFSVAFPKASNQIFEGNLVRVMTRVLFLRHVLVNAIVLYYDKDRYVFSKKLALRMAIAYTLGAVIGFYVYLSVSESFQRLFLGIYCLVFLALCILYVGKRVMDKRRAWAVLRDGGTPQLAESEWNTRPNWRGSPSGKRHPVLSARPFNFSVNYKSRSGNTETEGEPPADLAVTPPPLSVVYLSAATSDAFTADEAVAPELSETLVPPLTPSKLSPSSTMVHTRVRINRLVSNGRIIREVSYFGVLAAVAAGTLSSISGVGSPPLFFLTSVYDAPAYLVASVMAAQEIPGSLLRFVLCFLTGTYQFQDLLLLLALVVGYLGGALVVYDFGLRRFFLFTFKTKWLYFCCLLLCAGAAPLSRASWIIYVCLAGSIGAVGLCAFWEWRYVREALLSHAERCRCLEEERKRQEQMHPASRAQGEEEAYWAGYDNDDDREYNGSDPSNARGARLAIRTSPSQGAALVIDPEGGVKGESTAIPRHRNESTESLHSCEMDNGMEPRDERGDV